MNIHQVKAILLKEGFVECFTSRLPNELGSTIKLSNGSLVVVYDSGKWAVQGKNQAPAFQALESYAPRTTPPKRPPSKKTISRYELRKLVRVLNPTKRGDSR